MARPGPKPRGGAAWRRRCGRAAGPLARLGSTGLTWALGFVVGAAAHQGQLASWAPVEGGLGVAVGTLAFVGSVLAASRTLRPRRVATAPSVGATAAGPAASSAAERGGAARGSAAARSAAAAAVSALNGPGGRPLTGASTPRALLRDGEAALPQATGALLQVLAQVLAPCRVGLFYHDAQGTLAMRASKATLQALVPGKAPGAPAASGPASGKGVPPTPAEAQPDVEKDWPEPVLQRLRQAAARRQAGPLPVGEPVTELWAAPILEAPREPGAGHLWGLLAVLRPSARAWSSADVALLEGVAGQLALAWGLEQALRLSRRHLQRLERIATTDGLTELVNQRHFAKLFDLQLARARRYGRRLSLIFLDIDHFKEVNDTHGHQAGDEVLKKVAEVLRGTARCTDTVARLGGEEFAVLMEETGAKGAQRYAERIRQALGRELFTAEGGAFRKTCSLGIATFPEHGAQAKELMARADQALYLAKRTGRNRTVIYRAEAMGRESSP